MRTVNVDIGYEVGTRKYHYVGVGSSKEVYQLVTDNDAIIKVPRALSDTYGLNGNTLNVFKPENLDQVDEVLGSISDQSEGMVWPVGQLLVEIFVWEKLLELEKEGYDISCFARIKDYYFDNWGIPVIIQEKVEDRCPSGREWEEFNNKFEIISDILEERWDIRLHDIREGNIGFIDDEPKLYDFGMINYIFDDYMDYDAYEEACFEEEDDYYDDEEDC